MPPRTTRTARTASKSRAASLEDGVYTKMKNAQQTRMADPDYLEGLRAKGNRGNSARRYSLAAFIDEPKTGEPERAPTDAELTEIVSAFAQSDEDHASAIALALAAATEQQSEDNIGPEAEDPNAVSPEVVARWEARAEKREALLARKAKKGSKGGTVDLSPEHLAASGFRLSAALSQEALTLSLSKPGQRVVRVAVHATVLASAPTKAAPEPVEATEAPIAAVAQPEPLEAPEAPKKPAALVRVPHDPAAEFHPLSYLRHTLATRTDGPRNIVKAARSSQGAAAFVHEPALPGARVFERVPGVPTAVKVDKSESGYKYLFDKDKRFGLDGRLILWTRTNEAGKKLLPDFLNAPRISGLLPGQDPEKVPASERPAFAVMGVGAAPISIFHQGRHNGWDKWEVISNDEFILTIGNADMQYNPITRFLREWNSFHLHNLVVDRHVPASRVSTVSVSDRVGATQANKQAPVNKPFTQTPQTKETPATQQQKTSTLESAVANLAQRFKSVHVKKHAHA